MDWWEATGASGHDVIRYRLRRDDPSPAPWTPEGKPVCNYTLVTWQEAERLYKEGKERDAAASTKEEAEETEGKGEEEEEEKDKKKRKKQKTLQFTAKFLDLVNLDAKNNSKWTDLISGVEAGDITTFADFKKRMQEEFSCPICLDPLKQPITLGCTHNLCSDCLIDALKYATGKRLDS